MATSTYYSLRCQGCKQRLADLYSGQNMHIAIKCPRCKSHNDFSTVRVEILFLQLEAPKGGGHAPVRAGSPRLAGN